VKKTALQLLGLFAVLGTSGSAMAQMTGKILTAALPEMTIAFEIIPANATWTFTTSNLQPSTADTVLHIQDAGNGGFVGGNDDFNGFASSVSVSGGPSGRSVYAVIRSYSEDTNGTCDLTVTDNATGQVMDTRTSTPFGVWRYFTASTLPAGTKVYTTELLKQANDTVLLVLSGAGASVAAGYTDDGGLGFMSKTVLPASASGAVFAMGRYPGSAGTGGTTLVWDGDMTDSDGDGLSNTLEETLHTDPSKADTDGDGLSDGVEIQGGTVYAARYPTFGADPLVKDLFVEADWVSCDSAGAPCFGNVNTYQLDGTKALETKRVYYGPTAGSAQPATDTRVAVHMDIGVENPAAAGDLSLTDWGNWFGAGIRAASLGTNCGGTRTLTAGRDRFHLAIVGTQATGGEGDWCAAATSSGRILAHELGHNCEIGHHYGWAPTGAFNYKWIRPSIMNYAYQNQPSDPAHPNNGFFSVAPFRGITFNPSSVNEASWRGGNTIADLAILDWLGYKRSGNSVDWNQNGLLEPSTTTTKGRVNQRGSSGRMRDTGYSDGVAPNSTDPSMAWYNTPAGARLYLFFTHNGDAAGNQKIAYVSTTNVQSACSGFTSDFSRCTTFSTLADVPNQPNYAAGAVGVTEYTETNGTKRLMIVSRGTDNKLDFQKLTVNSSGVESWSSSSTIDTTNTVTGAVSAIYESSAGRVHVYAVATSGNLRRWSYNISTGSWDQKNVTQKWSSSGTPTISTQAGIGVTWGYDKGNSTTYIFGAIPNGSGNVILARRNPTNKDQWDNRSLAQYQDLNGTARTFTTDGQPGLAYQPFNNSIVNVGRFSMLARVPGAGFGNSPVIAYTEGNDPSGSATTYRESTWYGGLYYFQEDGAIQGKASSLLYDPAHDTNLRGAFSDGLTQVWFQPLADGQVNANFTDQNDYDAFKVNLGCPFLGGCKSCTAMNADGTCATWQ
jgi:hypothetical protein